MVITDPTVHAVVLGQVIAALRKRQRASQQDFARAVGVSQATLSRIERGQAVPDHYTFTLMADQFGMSAAELEATVAEAIANTRRAAAGATNQGAKGLDWGHVIKVAGVVGLIGLAAFAVATALSEDEDELG